MRVAVKALLLLLAVWPLAASRLWAAGGSEAQAFTAAEKVYLDADYHNAEIYFGEFLQKFPNSAHVPEAVLYQAQARLRLGNYAGALQLLAAHQKQAGALADWYLLCRGEAFLAQGDLLQAQTNFTRLLQDYPTSTHRLSAAVNAAVVEMRLANFGKATELLGQTNGVFQLAATNHANPEVIRGYLLLSEAQLALNDTRAAEISLQALSASPLDATNNWQRQFLLCRVYEVEGRLEEALQNVTNLNVLAQATGQHAFEAQSISFEGGVLERLGRRAEALAAYQKNLSAGVPPDHQRKALLKSTELCLALGKPGEAAQVLQAFLTQFPTNSCSDLALLTLGELRLRQYDPGLLTNQVALVTTNVPAGATNFLEDATSAFQGFRARFPNSALVGKAQLDLGWCYWLAGKIAESRATFQSAAALLPPSAEQAQALFKLADAHYLLRQYPAAISNYEAVAEGFPGLPAVRTNLAEPALYQIVRASQAAGDDHHETNALARILSRYPDGIYAQRAVLLAGQHLGRRFPAEARQLFCDAARTATNSVLLPEIQLAIARTYEQEARWEEAIHQYDTWLNTFTNLDATSRAEYFRAHANYEAGHETNALAQFTNLVARFPTSEYASLAQWWVADYFFAVNKPHEAEINYKLVFQNWPSSPLAYPARLMAGRMAVVRQGWDDAADYFRSLQNDPNCPSNLRAQALFAFGDTLLSRNSTNKLDYDDAFATFDLVCKNYPTNAIATLAWGQKAICYLQFARISNDPADYAKATNAFQQVIDSSMADASARSIAEVGLAFTLEKMAETRQDPERTDLLNTALQHYQRVFYDNDFLRHGEKPDPFWTRKAGMEAGRLAERLNLREHAIRVYQRLQQMFPPLRLEDRIKALQAQG